MLVGMDWRSALGVLSVMSAGPAMLSFGGG